MTARVIKQSKPGKKSVELSQPVPGSRIRRDPVTVVKPVEGGKELWWRSSEGEIALALIGIAGFALAIDVITLAISAYWS